MICSTLGVLAAVPLLDLARAAWPAGRGHARLPPRVQGRDGRLLRGHDHLLGRGGGHGQELPQEKGQEGGLEEGA